jgi:hypothetical protein
MSEQDKNPRGGVRRVGRKDRKKRLFTPDDLFPPDDGEATRESGALRETPLQATTPDTSNGDPTQPNTPTVSMKPMEDEALFAPGDEMFAAPRETPPGVIPLPPEERFPPLPYREEITQVPAKPMSAPAPTPRKSTLVPNLVAMLFAIGTVGLCGYYAFIWFNPYSALNPLAPPTPLPRLVTTTPEAPITATFTPVVIAVESPVPTDSLYPFVLIDVIYMPNPNSDGCNWASIAGTVTAAGQPLNGYRVRVTSATDSEFDESVFSGSTSTFGAGGFELPLGGAPQAGEYLLRLFDPAGAPVSAEYPIATQATCDTNVTLVNFVETR